MNQRLALSLRAGLGSSWAAFGLRRGTGENGVKLGIFNDLMINFVGSSYMRLDPK
jgi:hypothetical protein